jgi:hypothetical protein
MASDLSWPALAGIEDLETPRPQEIRTRRGVWGKVHEARTDFRWIARSAGFGEGAPPLERLFWAGPEDQPARACFWRAMRDRWLAIAAYPSRAVDRARRRGFCERQILEWAPTEEARTLPAAAAALLLLPRAEGFDDALWWDRAPMLARAPDLALPIGEEQAPCFELTEQTLAAAVRRGLAKLRAAVAEEEFMPHLAALYAALLAGREPAVLGGLSRPLAGAALAALLLPLPRELADRLSVAGWLFSPAVEPARLASNWQAIALPPEAWARSRLLSCQPGAEGYRLAQALLAGEWHHPEPAPPPAPGHRQPAEPAWPGASPEIEPAQTELQRADLPWGEAPRAPRPGTILPLPEPPPEAPVVLREIYEFARAVDRRWLAPEALERTYREAPHRTPIDAAVGEPLFRWIERLGALCPSTAHAEQWAVKVDLLRALALALVPSPDTVGRIGEFGSDRVPPLLYAPALVAGPQMLRDRLGDQMFEWCAEASRRCRSRRWGGWVEAWLGPHRSGLFR